MQNLLILNKEKLDIQKYWYAKYFFMKGNLILEDIQYISSLKNKQNTFIKDSQDLKKVKKKIIFYFDEIIQFITLFTIIYYHSF